MRWETSRGDEWWCETASGSFLGVGQVSGAFLIELASGTSQSVAKLVIEQAFEQFPEAEIRLYITRASQAVAESLCDCGLEFVDTDNPKHLRVIARDSAG